MQKLTYLIHVLLADTTVLYLLVPSLWLCDVVVATSLLDPRLHRLLLLWYCPVRWRTFMQCATSMPSSLRMPKRPALTIIEDYTVASATAETRGRGLLGCVVALLLIMVNSNVERFRATPCSEKLIATHNVSLYTHPRRRRYQRFLPWKTVYGHLDHIMLWKLSLVFWEPQWLHFWRWGALRRTFHSNTV